MSWFVTWNLSLVLKPWIPLLKFLSFFKRRRGRENLEIISHEYVMFYMVNLIKFLGQQYCFDVFSSDVFLKMSDWCFIRV